MKKLIFRILGALASALIIVSVFVPFVSVTGYSVSLWEYFDNTIYLPIMIIVFGAIGVIFFTLNIKTEFAYMSTGAIIFFLVMRTIDILNQGAFNTLSVGYYFLAIGAILTGVMAFLTNLKTKTKKEEAKMEEVIVEEPSMLDQIDKLYNDQTTIQNDIQGIQIDESVIEPLPIQPLQSDIPSISPINANVEEVIIPSIEEPQIPKNEVEPVLDDRNIQSEIQPTNPVVSEFEQPVLQPTNPVVSEFEQQVVQPTNPVVSEFEQQEVEEIKPLTPINNGDSINPVLQEFTNTNTQSQNTNSNSLDIFGQ